MYGSINAGTKAGCKACWTGSRRRKGRIRGGWCGRQDLQVARATEGDAEQTIGEAWTGLKIEGNGVRDGDVAVSSHVAI